MLNDLRKKFGRKMKVLNTIELSSAALIHNYKYYAKKHPEAKICPVLKSNAYGHGLIEIARICEKLRPPYLIVDSFYEALELKKAGVKTPCLIIGYTLPENYKDMSFNNVAVSILDLNTIHALGRLNKKVKVHLKIDTGMHRQGILIDDLPEALELISKYKKLELEGIFTHLADADNSKKTFTISQVNKFKKAIKNIDVKWKHISATAGAGIIKDKNFNMIRIGLGLYGDSPIDKDAKNLKPIMRFSSTLIDIKTLKKGDCVSYGCTFKAKQNMKIGLIPAGYYEGIDRRLSNKGYVYYGNVKCKILGRVCMNLCVIDLSQVKGVRKGAKIDIIKSNVREIAELSETISYVVWTKISPTIRRVAK
ncbi:alanine racemase [Patescibacteria group bacterium]